MKRALRATLLGIALLSTPGVWTALADEGTMTFTSFTVPAVSRGDDLYEPFIYTAPTGVFYITGHVQGIFTERTPAFAGILTAPDHVDWLPVPTENSTIGDEGVFAADSQGTSWLFDNGPSYMSLYKFCSNLFYECDFSPDVWGDPACTDPPAVPTTSDRPWASYSSFLGGRLLLENDGYVAANVSDFTNSHFAQIAITSPTNPSVITWNTCAAWGYAPGPGGVRASDGMIAVPQAQKSLADNHWYMHLLIGYDLNALSSSPQLIDMGLGHNLNDGGKNFGFASFSQAGTLFLAAVDNTGQVRVATSTDLANFRFVQVPRPPTASSLRFLWISGSQTGEGALLTFVTNDTFSDTASIYATHVYVNQGIPSVSPLATVVQGLPHVCGDYSGSSIGPDGNAYVISFSTPYNKPTGQACGDQQGNTPLTVYVQTGGPVL